MTEHGNTTITLAPLLFCLTLLVVPASDARIECNFFPLSKASFCIAATKQYASPVCIQKHKNEFTLSVWGVFRTREILLFGKGETRTCCFCVISNVTHPQKRGVFFYYYPGAEVREMATDDGILWDKKFLK